MIQKSPGNGNPLHGESGRLLQAVSARSLALHFGLATNLPNGFYSLPLHSAALVSGTGE